MLCGSRALQAATHIKTLASILDNIGGGFLQCRSVKWRLMVLSVVCACAGWSREFGQKLGTKTAASNRTRKLSMCLQRKSFNVLSHSAGPNAALDRHR